MSGARRAPYRCRSCGYDLRGDQSCPKPGHDERVEWPHAMRWAFWYVCRESESGRDLDEFVQRPGDTYTGVTPGELALALAYARKWSPPTFREGELPMLSHPGGLFG